MRTECKADCAIDIHHRAAVVYGQQAHGNARRQRAVGAGCAGQLVKARVDGDDGVLSLAADGAQAGCGRVTALAIVCNGGNAVLLATHGQVSALVDYANPVGERCIRIQGDVSLAYLRGVFRQRRRSQKA